MDIANIETLVGTVLTLLVTVGLFFLAGIKKSQDTTNTEIKEMNKDIRSVLIRMGQSDEKVGNIEYRINHLESYVEKIDCRVMEVEKKFGS